MTTTSTAPAQRTDYTHITAEDAPLGVQLWPTTAPQYAPNFTLDSVETHRGVNGTTVKWTYQSGKTRWFDAGERVACLLPIA